MRYFQFDTDFRKDDRILALRSGCGSQGIDAYLAVLGLLYESEADLELRWTDVGAKSVAVLLQMDVDTLKRCVETMVQVGLFEDFSTDENAVLLHSKRAAKAIDEYHKKQETARQNGKKPKSRAKANQRGTKKEATSVPTSGQRQELIVKVLDTHKGYLNTSGEAGAGGEDPAPPSPVMRNDDDSDYSLPQSVAEQVADHFKAVRGQRCSTA